MQRRLLIALSCAQVPGSAGFTLGFTASSLVGKQLSGGDSLAGFATACLTIGSALASAYLARLMATRGRRFGLVLGWGVATCGAFLGVLAIEVRSFVLFLVACLMIGTGQGSNLLTRYAAVDLERPERRARAIAQLIFMSTFGAGVGPLLVGSGERLGVAVGLNGYAGVYLAAGIGSLLAATITQTGIRQDPLLFAFAAGLAQRAKKSLSLRSSLSIVARSSVLRLAIVAMLVAQVSMQLVMTMTPLHVKEMGHSTHDAGMLVALHIASMYAFAPVIGWLCMRYRGQSLMVVGWVFLAGATLTSAFADRNDLALYVGMGILGVAWSVALIAASTLITDATSPVERTSVQGAADLVMNLGGGAAGLAAGAVMHALEYRGLGLVSFAAVCTQALFVVSSLAMSRVTRLAVPE